MKSMFNFFKKKKAQKKEPNVLREVLTAIYKKKRHIYSSNELSGIEEYEKLKTLSDSEKKEIILQLSNLIAEFSIEQVKIGHNHYHLGDNINYYGRSIAFAVQSGLLRKRLNYNEEEWMNLFSSFEECRNKIVHHKQLFFPFHNFPINYAIKQIEYYLKDNQPSVKLSLFIKKTLQLNDFNSNAQSSYGATLNKVAIKLRKIVETEETVSDFCLKTEDIGDSTNKIINSIDKNREAYHLIFQLSSTASSAKPSKKFNSQIWEYQDTIGLDTYKKIAHQIIRVATNYKFVEKTMTYNYGEHTTNYVEISYLCKPSQNFIKGIVWTLGRFSDKETIRLLTQLCEKSYTKIPQKGPAAAALGNACVLILGNMRGKDGLGALARLKLKVRQNNVKKSIDQLLIKGAAKYSVSVEELKEMATPDFKFERGTRSISFDDYSLNLYLEGKKIHQQWIKPDGSGIKSVPSYVKNNKSLSNILKEVRKEIKEVQKVYGAQKQRIDNQFILDRTWQFPTFEKYYLDNGLVYPITSKLIWVFELKGKSVPGILREDHWIDIADQPIEWINEVTIVRLWHPVNYSEETIVAWREKIMQLEWQQPIKQAFREIYILTEAEINTNTYSNRMAAHILKQHQFSSLANLRGWKYSLMGWYDDGRDSDVCKKYLPEHKITAEYWINELHHDQDWNDAGIWHHIATDQIKFNDGNGESLELTKVPKMVFTEIMRDVDLFVGVSSVGNDPQWMDNNGERENIRAYWTSYSFGNLTEIAKTRKTILQRLLPRLKKIRDRTQIDGKFLHVKGNLRTYKIHIGSGNILMEPNDQYLCIVPSRSVDNAAGKFMIPFEGDRGLSIVLSKAFLLVEDDKIKDSTITSQINRV